MDDTLSVRYHNSHLVPWRVNHFVIYDLPRIKFCFRYKYRNKIKESHWLSLSSYQQKNKTYTYTYIIIYTSFSWTGTVRYHLSVCYNTLLIAFGKQWRLSFEYILLVCNLWMRPTYTYLFTWTSTVIDYNTAVKQ